MFGVCNFRRFYDNDFKCFVTGRDKEGQVGFVSRLNWDTLIIWFDSVLKPAKMYNILFL